MLQYLLNRKQIFAAGSLAPAVTPIVRVPANGVERNQSFAKQALDRGVYGVVWPHIGDADQAYNAVASCRYARPATADLHEPAGVLVNAMCTVLVAKWENAVDFTRVEAISRTSNIRTFRPNVVI
jgi:4-hydroxy-2-oxoheptanedioate aldolase